MKWLCKIWDADSDSPHEAAFLSASAISLLERSEDQIFDDWQKHFPKDKSLANVLSRTILPAFDDTGFVFANGLLHQYATLRAFHHQKSTSDLWVEMFRRFNHESTSNFLVITQTAAFKEKFLYDSATMSIETLTKNYGSFLYSMNLQSKPRVHFLAFHDMNFRTDVLNRGNKKFLKLERT